MDKFNIAPSCPPPTNKNLATALVGGNKIEDFNTNGVVHKQTYNSTRTGKRFSLLSLSRQDHCLHEELEGETHVCHWRAGTRAVLRRRAIL